MIVGVFLLPCTMASCMNTATYAVHGPLGNKVIPAYHFEGADVGHAFFWEERSWLNEFGMKDLVSYRNYLINAVTWRKLLHSGVWTEEVSPTPGTMRMH